MRKLLKAYKVIFFLTEPDFSFWSNRISESGEIRDE